VKIYYIHHFDIFNGLNESRVEIYFVNSPVTRHLHQTVDRKLLKHKLLLIWTSPSCWS